MVPCSYLWEVSCLYRVLVTSYSQLSWLSPVCIGEYLGTWPWLSAFQFTFLGTFRSIFPRTVFFSYVEIKM